MYFYPGKMKTHTRIFNKVRASVFALRQLDLFSHLVSDFDAAQKLGGFKSGSYVTPGQTATGCTKGQNS